MTRQPSETDASGYFAPPGRSSVFSSFSSLSSGLFSRKGCVLLWLFILAVPASFSSAQVNDNTRFREVEPGFEDVNDQVLNMRLQLVDMRTPIGFEKVYEIVGSDGLFARRSGAVTAVFDRSIYAGNAMPLIPAGTVFYLGSLPVDLGQPGVLSPDRLGHRPRVTGERADTPLANTAAEAQVALRPQARRLDLRVQPGESTSHPPMVNPRATIWSSESYRQRRVGELIRAAAWKARELEAAAER
ncbi:hypothetical protein MNBD_PLANCTO03-471 [hydrothermal vent metagenome]|uniref:Uncharacterized protein n=1 Tax=hydrothermal vent metagenome TaxID=652676 RepID=A0A3B1DEH0_9ZZZZ